MKNFANTNLIKEYSNNGIVIIKNFLSTKELNVIKSAFVETVKNKIHIKKIRSFDDKTLHENLINLREKNPKKFGEIYDELKLNADIRSIFYSTKTLNLMKKFLKIKTNQVFINGFMLRMDVPNDTRNSLDWHQDGKYYNQTHPHYNAAVCWIPLVDVNEKNGSIKFIKNTHNKILKAKRSKKLNSSENYKIKINECSDKVKVNDLVCKKRDMAIFHLNTIHRSGVNTSKKIRFVLGARFHDMSKKFSTGKEIYI